MKIYSYYKKTILLIAILFFISGCANTQAYYNEKNAIFNSNENEVDVTNRINDLKNGLTPKVKPDEKKSSEKNMQKDIKLENLSNQFDKVIIKTNLGNITIGFYADESPVTVNNFLNLAKSGFYDGVKFHRVIKNFMIQGGDPNSKDDDWSNDGMGGPGYQFKDEFNNHKLVRGSLAMANSGPNSNGSQFFIVTADETPWLDGKHTNFGYVIDGMDIIDKIEAVDVNENDHPIKDAMIESVELVEKIAH